MRALTTNQPAHPYMKTKTNPNENLKERTQPSMPLRNTLTQLANNKELQMSNGQIKKRDKRTRFSPVDLEKEPFYRSAAEYTVRYMNKIGFLESEIRNRDVEQCTRTVSGRNRLMADLGNVVMIDVAGEIFMWQLKYCCTYMWRSEQGIGGLDAVASRNMNPLKMSFIQSIDRYLMLKAMRAVWRCLGPFSPFRVKYEDLLPFYEQVARLLSENWELVHQVADRLANTNLDPVCPDQLVRELAKKIVQFGNSLVPF